MLITPLTEILAGQRPHGEDGRGSDVFYLYTEKVAGSKICAVVI